MGFQSPDAREISRSVTDMVLGEVRRTFNPEFINRIDEIIVFDALSDDDLRRILGLLVDQLNEQPGRTASSASTLTPRGGRLDHRRDLQGPVVRRAAAAPRHPAVRRGSRCPRNSSGAPFGGATSRWGSKGTG